MFKFPVFRSSPLISPLLFLFPQSKSPSGLADGKMAAGWTTGIFWAAPAAGMTRRFREACPDTDQTVSAHYEELAAVMTLAALSHEGVFQYATPGVHIN